MTKRRRGSKVTHYQVPTLQYLASQALRNAVPNWHRTPILTVLKHTGLLPRMDSEMSESRSSSTQTSKRSRTDAADGAKEVGQGHLVTVPRSVPHIYNNNYTVKLTYVDTYTHTVDYTLNAAVQQYRSNSIFDPDLSGTGHQP